MQRQISPTVQGEKEKTSDGKNYEDITENSPSRTKPVKTGDDTEIWMFILLDGVAFLVCCLMVWKGGKRA